MNIHLNVPFSIFAFQMSKIYKYKFRYTLPRKMILWFSLCMVSFTWFAKDTDVTMFTWWWAQRIWEYCKQRRKDRQGECSEGLTMSEKPRKKATLNWFNGNNKQEEPWKEWGIWMIFSSSFLWNGVFPKQPKCKR